jgi:hypothetical protein
MMMAQDSANNSIPRACTTYGCENQATMVGTFTDGDEVFRDVAYCTECAGYVYGQFEPTGQINSPKVRRYIVGTYCPRGSGHFELIADAEYDGSCGSKGWPLYIEVEDGDDLSQLPEGYFEGA